LPGLKTFVTLSPIPGLTKWNWIEEDDPDCRGDDPTQLKALAAHYLMSAAKRPTASRSIRSPASISATAPRSIGVHADADTSEKGQRAIRRRDGQLPLQSRRRSRKTTSASPPPMKLRPLRISSR
jgi:hypothetical protein